jgi:thermolabile hemolysin
MKKSLIIGGLILASSLFPVRAIAATFSQIVVYGDSLSDLGRAAAATSSLPPEFKFPAYPNGNGRFSNGSIWVEYLAAKLGVANNPNTNFAIGGATTGTVNLGQALSPSFIGIQTQVANNLISDPAALYVIWGGANDYLSATPSNPAVSIGNLAGEVNTLIGRNAKNILVVNLPNLGEIPATINTGISVPLDLLTQAHNTGLAASINALSQSNPTVKLNLLDVNSLFSQVVANPSSFGFNNVTDPCYADSTNICSTPNTYLFWDDRHPTTVVQQLIGNLAFQTVAPTAVPEPMTTVGSLVAIGSAIALKRKLKTDRLKAKKPVQIV